MDRQDLQDGFGSKYFILSIMYIHVKILLSFLRLGLSLVCQGPPGLSGTVPLLAGIIRSLLFLLEVGTAFALPVL